MNRTEKVIIDWIMGDPMILDHLSRIASRNDCPHCPEDRRFGDHDLQLAIACNYMGDPETAALYVEMAGGDPSRLPLLRNSLSWEWKSEVRWDVVRHHILCSSKNRNKENKMSKIKITASAEAFRLDLEHGSRFQTTGSLSGSPVPGIGDMNRGLLPEPYHAAAMEAVYAVYHFETPILWKAQDGKWYVPMHSYSSRTSAYRNRMIQALEMFHADVERI
jgi:hypothetical protein